MRIFFLLLLGTILSLITQPVFAQTAGQVSVSPSLIQIDLHKDQPETTIFYKNLTNSTIELSLRAQDFTELEDRGQINFLNAQDAKNYSYGLSSWITFETNDIILSPGEQQAVKITVNKEKLTLGGHYASILAEIIQSNQNNQVNVHGILASLLFVRAGSAYDREEGKIASVALLQSWPYFPEAFDMRFQNTGNVEVAPYGLLQIHDMFGNLVAKGILNGGSSLTLPESIRRYDIPITKLQPFLLPGIYTADLRIHFGDTKKQAITKHVFFSQGSIDFVKILAGIILILIVFFTYKKWKQPFKR